jgi:hypothetical protein
MLQVSNKELKRRVEKRKGEENLSDVRDFAIAKRSKDEYHVMTGDFVRIVRLSCLSGAVVNEIEKQITDLQI